MLRRLRALFKLIAMLGYFRLIDGRKYVKYPNGEIRRTKLKTHGNKRHKKAKKS